jgi:hypothetical protein
VTEDSDDLPKEMEMVIDKEYEDLQSLITKIQNCFVTRASPNYSITLGTRASLVSSIDPSIAMLQPVPAWRLISPGDMHIDDLRALINKAQQVLSAVTTACKLLDHDSNLEMLQQFAKELVNTLLEMPVIREAEPVQLFKGSGSGNYVMLTKTPGLIVNQGNFVTVSFEDSECFAQQTTPEPGHSLCIVSKGDVLRQACKGDPSYMWALREHYPTLYAGQLFQMQLASYHGWASYVYGASGLPSAVVVPWQTEADLLVDDLALLPDILECQTRLLTCPFNPRTLSDFAITAAYCVLELPDCMTLQYEANKGNILASQLLVGSLGYDLWREFWDFSPALSEGTLRAALSAISSLTVPTLPLSPLPAADFAGIPGQLLSSQPQLGPIANGSSASTSIPFCSNSDYTDSTDAANGSACVESAAAPLFSEDEEVTAALMHYAAAVIVDPSLMQLSTCDPDYYDRVSDNSGASLPVVKEEDHLYSDCDPDFAFAPLVN